ncbi:MAG TPA: EcsC family protein [Nocardioides sp.]|nr:EcsC family protein [Nocardioides sp.]
MSRRTKYAKAIGGALAPKAIELAPGATASVIQAALHRAIVGVGPLPGAAESADRQLARNDGDVNRAISDLIRIHVALAGTAGFATNIGGMVTVAVTLPANLTGLAVIESRLVACIAHLRGYDINDPRVRNAILIAELGDERVRKQIKSKKLPGTPMAVATAPAYDPNLDRIVAAEVAAEMLTAVAGKRLATTIGKHVPIIGGAVGASTDGWETYQIGRYARREFLPRPRA